MNMASDDEIKISWHDRSGCRPLTNKLNQIVVHDEKAR